MPFCTVCGTAYTAKTKFCTGCGTLLQLPANPLQKEIPDTVAPTAAITVQQSIPVEARPQFNMGKWLQKNKALSLIIILAGVGFGSYKLFFGSSPGKDGVAADTSECSCTEKRNTAWQTNTQSFITASANRQFLSIDEIGACADSLASELEMAYDSCTGEAHSEYTNSSKKFTGKQFDEFTAAYIKSIAGCQNANNNFRTAFAQCRNKIIATLQHQVGLRNVCPPVEAAVETNDHKETEVATDDRPAADINLVDQSNTTPGTVDFRQHVIALFNAENSIYTPADIEQALDLYSFPMYRNFKLLDVTRERLYKVYDYSYLKKWKYHKISGYENKIKIIPLSDGRIRVEANFQFESGDNRDGTGSGIQQVSNAYIFNAAGKIVSVGIVTDKNL